MWRRILRYVFVALWAATLFSSPLDGADMTIGSLEDLITSAGSDDGLVGEAAVQSLNAGLAKHLGKRAEFLLQLEKGGISRGWFRFHSPFRLTQIACHQFVPYIWCDFPPSAAEEVRQIEAGKEMAVSGVIARCDVHRERNGRLALNVDIKPASLGAPQIEKRTEQPQDTRATLRKPEGLMLSPGRDGRMQGGRNTLEDLEQLLSPYVEPGTDTTPRPELKIYRGITCLMPLDAAMKAIGSPRRANSKVAVACPGFPLNSFFSYSIDGVFDGRFNRLYLILDRADQVVSVQLVDETPHGLGPGRVVPFRTYNFVNARQKATQSYTIRLNVTADAHLLKIHTSLHGNGKGLEESVWYLPKPLAGLIRTCTQKSLNAGW